MSAYGQRPPDFSKDFQKFINDFKNNFKFIGGIAILILIVIGVATSFYTVEPEEEAVVLRFGKYVGTYPPGLHFRIPFGIDKKIKIRTKTIHQQEFGFRTAQKSRRYSNYSYDTESLMLTGDLNVADVKWVVQFNISDPYKYLFKTSSPIKNLRDVSESVMRRIIGDRLVTEVLTTGRVEIASNAKVLLQEVLDEYDMGIRISAVKLQDVNPPDTVKPSFNEVNEAKQEQEEVINRAEEAYNKVIPEAKGKADKMISEAEGYAQAIVNRAKGDAGKFTSILKEYRRAPSITRKRIYIETMEEVFSTLKNFTIVDSKIKGLLPVYQSMKKSSEQ